MTAPRIAPGSFRETGPLAWVVAYIGSRQARSGPLTLFTTLGRHRKLFRAWLRFAGRLMPGGSLPRVDTELVILRVAHLRSCDYEHRHHVRIGRRAGLTREDIDRVALGPDASGWSARHHALLRAVDALHTEGDLDDETWHAVHAHLDDKQCIELCMLVGHYEMLATTIAALRIQPDPPRGRRA
ncbi:MAG TPA: carboxymuconolactone decarboxylase family protein [Jatrophihabitantaceae bacterium]|nr:carboxymuconolactone decarboxylase family protein [Jatrophihabitantaceae bacterium]